MCEATRSYWVIEYVNGRQFFGLFNGRWLRTRELDVAKLWQSKGEAENALEALIAEAGDRLERAKQHWPDPIWWDVRGGLCRVSEVEQTIRLKPRGADRGDR